MKPLLNRLLLKDFINKNVIVLFYKKSETFGLTNTPTSILSNPIAKYNTKPFDLIEENKIKEKTLS